MLVYLPFCDPPCCCSYPIRDPSIFEPSQHEEQCVFEACDIGFHRVFAKSEIGRKVHLWIRKNEKRAFRSECGR
eukprot:873315-Pleurochrysis_carterae.AAC.1